MAAIKKMVSKNKRRYKKDGFDLDLTYIDDRIIAMGFPADSIEGVYRNHISAVIKFLNSKHREHYKVFNLCSERHYDFKKFYKAIEFPFDDHHPPSLELMQQFCQDLSDWLHADNDNVAAIHCKAGKGRTGVMICAYLLQSGCYATAVEALDFYGKTRTKDGKGVTIPSQRRYVRYYERVLTKSPICIPQRTVQLAAVQLCPTPTPSPGTPCTPTFTVYKDMNKTKLFPCQGIELERTVHGASIFLKPSVSLTLSNDICVEVFHKPHKLAKKEKLFHFWFNTAFLQPHSEGDGAREAQGRDPNLTVSTSNGVASNSHSCGAPVGTDYDWTLVLPKCELDRANKDKAHKIYSEHFKIVLYFRDVSSSLSGDTKPTNFSNPLLPPDVLQSSPEARVPQEPSGTVDTPPAPHVTKVGGEKGASGRCTISEEELSDPSSEDEWTEQSTRV